VLSGNATLSHVATAVSTQAAEAAKASEAISDFHRSYLTVAFLGAAAFLLVGGTLAISRVVRPKNPNADKLLAYESGVDPVGAGWSQSQVRYYIFALLFVMFDVEAVFLFPWALRLEAFGVFGLIEMGIFVVILLLGLVYAWRKGVLRWV
jgi:NADH-quinone oxidoreductase subunit A